jgi:hypothetical protein
LKVAVGEWRGRKPLIVREELTAMFKNQGEAFIETLYRRIQELCPGE